MTMIKTFGATLALTAAATIAASAPALAAQADAKASAHVPYSDLNLSSAQGREVLDRRIVRAIEKVCGQTTGNIGLDASVRECQRETRSTAREARDLAVASYGENRLAGGSDKVIRLVAN